MNGPRSAGPRLARILMYTAYFEPEYSGAAMQALTLARQLRERGHAVEFVTNRWPGLSDTAVVDGFAVRRIESGRMRRHREFRLWFNLARYVWTRRRDFDVLHSHGAYFTNAFIGPLAKLLGLKSLIKASLADDDLRGLGVSPVGRLHRAMLKRTDALVAISFDLVEEFRAGGLRADRTHHIPNGVDTARFRPSADHAAAALRERLNLPADRRIALYVGVLDARKNILWLAEQWIAADAFGTGALLVALGPPGRDAGDAPIRAGLVELARRHPASFVLHDFRADVAPYYQCADLLILPSAKEGLPNVVLEAMACGLPCIAAHASGSRELVEDGETGYVYHSDDLPSLARAVQRCLSDEGIRLGANARRRAEERYAIGIVADRYQAVYARLMGGGRRVLYVENGIGYGGAVICLRHLVRNLDRAQFEPMVITGLGDDKYKDIANEARWKHIPDKRIDVMTLKRHLASHRWLDRVPGLRWVLNQLLARLDDVANFLPSLVQTAWSVHRFKPELIHVNNEPLCNRAAVLAGKLAGVPVVSHVRGDQQGSLMMLSLFKMPDFFIAVSRWVSESIGRIGVPDGKRTFIYDGIELENLDTQAEGSAFRQRHGIGESAFVVGLVGLLIPWKGQSIFVDAAKRLAADLPDATFAIVGGTPEEFRYFEASLRRAVVDADLQERIVFTGHVSEMAAVYNGLDVVVSASTSPEPLGTMIIEAMAMARPLIAPDHGGAVEMIQHEATGLLFDAGDTSALAAAIRRLHDDPAWARSLGAAARRHALATFAIADHVQRVEQVYREVLGLSMPGAAGH